MVQLIPTTELVTSILSNMCDHDGDLKQTLLQNVRNTAYSKFNLDIGNNIALHVVENDADVVNLTLPFYDERLDGVAGSKNLS